MKDKSKKSTYSTTFGVDPKIRILKSMMKIRDLLITFWTTI